MDWEKVVSLVIIAAVVVSSLIYFGRGPKLERVDNKGENEQVEDVLSGEGNSGISKAELEDPEEEVRKDPEEDKREPPSPKNTSHYGLFTDNTIKGSVKKDIAILILDDEDRTPQNLLASNISELLQSDNRKIYTGLLDAKAINKEGLNELLASNTQSITRYHPEKVLDYMVVGRLRRELQKNIHDAYTLNLYLQLSVIDLQDKSRSITQPFTGSGLHFQKAEVETKALGNLTEDISKKLNYAF